MNAVEFIYVMDMYGSIIKVPVHNVDRLLVYNTNTRDSMLINTIDVDDNKHKLLIDNIPFSIVAVKRIHESEKEISLDPKRWEGDDVDTYYDWRKQCHMTLTG